MVNQRIIITAAPANEPLTTAELREYLRIPSGTISDQITPAQTIAPGPHVIAAAYTLLGAAVDVSAVAAILALLESGTNGGGGTVDVKLQDSDAGAVWTDVTSGAFSQVAEATDNAIYEKEYAGGRRYLRAVATVAGATCDFGVSVIRQSPLTLNDTLIGELITEAREWAEKQTGRAFMLQTREAVFDSFPDSPCKLDCAPILAVSTFKYKDSAGSETTWLPATNYILETDSAPPRLSLGYGISWPSVTLYPVSGIRVAFTCGYSSSADAATQRAAVPQPIRKTMLRRIQWLYENRAIATAVVESRFAGLVLPEAVEKALAQELSPYRLWRFQ